MRSPATLASALFALSVVAVGGGCNFGESGIAPPTNRVFLPAGIVADPDADFIYVVNSNSDLRFNAGTLVALPALKPSDVPNIRALPTTLSCAKTRFSRTEAVPDDYCCVDLVDSNIINCNEPQFVQSDATIQIGSFGGAIEIHSYPNGLRRLFVAVRAEPSITFADVTITKSDSHPAGTVSTRCTGSLQDSQAQPLNPFCDDNWKVRRPGGATVGELVLPEEPHVLALDDDQGILYIGHLTAVANGELQGGGVSTLDICDPLRPSSELFAGMARNTFLPSATLSQSVAALSLMHPGISGVPIYATARYSTAISEMVFRSPPPSCQSQTRDLTMITREHFYSSAFLPNGADIRGILFSDDDTQAFVLHRNDSSSTSNPAAIVVLDRRPLADGTPANTPIDILEVCGGPTTMHWHDAGRGKRIYVTCYDDGQIYVVDPVELMVTAIIDAGAGPTSLAFSPRDPGVAYVASYANSHLSVIDLLPGSPTENHVVLRIGLPHGYGE
jgi:YVTN family beta-propeller protein